MEQVLTKLMGEMALPKEGATKPTPGGKESDFQKVLETQMSDFTEDSRMLENVMGVSSKDSNALKAIQAEQISIDPEKIGSGKRTDILEVLNDVNRSALQMDQMIEMVTSGESFTPQELLAIQAGVYQIIQEVDLTGQIVSSADRARNSLLNIQI